MPITSGSIQVLRRVNTGDYSHKEVKADVHFVVEPGEDHLYLMDDARTHAITQVAYALATVVEVANPPLVVVRQCPFDGPENVQSEEIKNLNKVDQVYPYPVDPPNMAPAEGVLGAQQEETKKRHRRTKAEMEAAKEAPTIVYDTKTTSPFPPKDLPEITDKDLTEACNVANKRVPATQIRNLIANYTDGPSATIPQTDRAEFLEKLKIL